MKLKLLAGAAIAAMTVATGAYAEQATGWYGAIDLGGNQKSEWKAKSAGKMVDGGQFVYNVSTGDDWAGFARLGYRYSPNWRVELEGGYRPGDVVNAIGFKRNYGTGLKDTALCTPKITLTGKPCGGPDGSFTQSSLMVNMIYDILPESTFHPFVGLGVGAVQSKVKMIGQYSVNPGGVPEHLSIVGDDIAPAAQLLAGMAWALTDSTSLDLTYRYMEVGDTTIGSKSSLATTGWVPGDFKGGFNNQTLTVGLRMAFGAPVPPPPPPPPAPEPEPAPPPPPPPPPVVEPVKPACDAREFIVYFEFDKSALTADASAVVSAAADYSKTCGAARVVVIGHTDTSGSVAYNVKLSERRGKVVADALAAQGVNPNVLAVDWKGESAPAVATGDGVKEPLNRRSTIDISF